MEDKPRSKRPYTKRSSDGSRPQRRSYGPRATDANRSDAPTPYGRRDDRKPYEKKAYEKKPYERKSDDRRPYDRKPDYRKKYTPKPKAQAPAEENGPVRLNKFIANSGICSRREADMFIETGQVTVFSRTSRITLQFASQDRKSVG